RLELARRTATVETGDVPVVTLFARLHDRIAAYGGRQCGGRGRCRDAAEQLTAHRIDLRPLLHEHFGATGSVEARRTKRVDLAGSVGRMIVLCLARFLRVGRLAHDFGGIVGELSRSPRALALEQAGTGFRQSLRYSRLALQGIGIVRLTYLCSGWPPAGNHPAHE